MKLTDQRRRQQAGTGLIEVFTDDAAHVILQMLPPGAPPVTLPMSPAQARGLAQGLLDGALEAERAAPPPVTGHPES